MKSFLAEQHSDFASAPLALRSVEPQDEQFLYEVYASTRAEELAQVAWAEAQSKAFLQMQLNLRDQAYRMHYPKLDDRIILFQNESVGRLIVARAEHEIRLIDIALLPEYRRAGVGASLIKELIREASASLKPVRLQVEKPNEQARLLYERLGFRTAGENDTHFQMEYSLGQ